MSDTTYPAIVCPGSGAFLDGSAVDGNHVTHCPVCDRTELAEPVPTPDDMRTRYFAVRIHTLGAGKPRHLARCYDDDGKLECCCGLTDLVGERL